MKTNNGWKELVTKLSEITEQLNEAGGSCDYGWPIHKFDDAIALYQTISDKPYCVVQDWVWWDLDCSVAMLNEVKNQNCLPAMIKTNFVIFDQAGRFSTGDWVRTGLLKRFHHNVFFETENTVYILIGEGTRRTINAGLACSFF